MAEKKEGYKRGLVSLSERTPEERSAIARKGVEARRKKKEEKLMLQNCMKALLKMKVNSRKREELLKSYGFTDTDMNNKTLLMVALFQKGIRGDVQATKEIIAMMDKLDLFEQSGQLQQTVNINLVSCGEDFQMSEEDEQELERIQNEE